MLCIKNGRGGRYQDSKIWTDGVASFHCLGQQASKPHSASCFYILHLIPVPASPSGILHSKDRRMGLEKDGIIQQGILSVLCWCVICHGFSHTHSQIKLQLWFTKFLMNYIQNIASSQGSHFHRDVTNAESTNSTSEYGTTRLTQTWALLYQKKQFKTSHLPVILY